MAQVRILGKGRSFYHCVSRVVGRRMLFGEEEKEQLVKLMRKLERFCGVEVISYCMMSNHFHLLVEVPEIDRGPDGEIDLAENELLDRIQRLYGLGYRREVAWQLKNARKHGAEEEAAAIRTRYTRNMCDLSCFMKMLKQRFSSWYNRRHERKGTLWEERFKSVLLEGDTQSLLAVSAYIDLNPVRAGICNDPKDYRWCSYGAALAGVREARLGLGRIFASAGESNHWGHVGPAYRKYAHLATEPQVGSKSAIQDVLSPQQRKKVLQQGGKLPLEELLRVRVRYFTDGLVLGSKHFVNEVFETNRQRFGVKRKSGARRMQGANWGELRALRDLKSGVFGSG